MTPPSKAKTQKLPRDPAKRLPEPEAKARQAQERREEQVVIVQARPGDLVGLRELTSALLEEALREMPSALLEETAAESLKKRSAREARIPRGWPGSSSKDGPLDLHCDGADRRGLAQQANSQTE